MAGPYSFVVKQVAVRYPHGVQAEDNTPARQTTVVLDNDPSDVSLQQRSIMTLVIPGDARADFVLGATCRIGVNETPEVPPPPLETRRGTHHGEEHGHHGR